MENTQAKQPLLPLIFCVLFIGVVLSCSVFFLTHTFIQPSGAESEQCYDGSAIEGDSFFARFRRAVYQNESLLSFISECEYRVLNTVNSSDVLVGKEDFLFATDDPETGYSYLQDYIGKATFTEEESAAILAELQRRRAFYEQKGAEYLLVVLPNAQTVYSEYMPGYLGNIHPDTRLAVLERYLKQNGYASFVNPTEELERHKSDGVLYNNTENSLNARGLYYVYLSICSRFDNEVLQHITPISRARLSFFEHRTAGKDIARRVGLSDVVQNRTVSLSGDTQLRYRYLFNTGLCSKTVKMDYSMDQIDSPSLLLQFTGTWERSQIEPFFSNTFTTVTYQTNLEQNDAIYERATPSVVIQFLYENELSLLLPQ
ncbi:MAG: hypothetical protein IJA78_03375 [Clostridia bacterium]|nr:hypothetical protein [Clostridia bacterium]